MKIGYARVSTQDQKLELQLDELNRYGCEKIYMEKVSGKNKERPELQMILAQLRSGDSIVVWKLDRLGRSIKVYVMEKLTILFRAKLTRQFADERCAAGA